MSTYIEQPRYSCALAAQQTVLAIPGALPIIHAGPGCSSKATASLATGSGYQGEGYAGSATVTATNTIEKDVVFGGEGKLRKTIEGALKVMDAELFVVLSGCTSDIVGDDSIHVAEEFKIKGYPVIGTETAGFKGSNYLGHEIVINSILDRFIPKDRVPQVKQGTVNVFSVVPYQDPFWRGDLIEYKRILKKLGLHVNILFGYESEGVKEWLDIPDAQFNLLIGPWLGTDIVKKLKDRYNTPFLHIPVPPVGGEATGDFLRKVGEFAGIDPSVTEKAISEEEHVFYEYFIAVSDFIADMRNNLPHELYTVSDSAYGLGVSNFLIKELGFIPKGLYAIENIPEAKIQLVREAAASIDERLAELYIQQPDAGLIERELRSKIKNGPKALILGSSWEKTLANELNANHLFLSVPIYDGVIVNRTYTGYTGGLNLIEDIYDGIFRKGSIARTTLAIGDTNH